MILRMNTTGTTGNDRFDRFDGFKERAGAGHSFLQEDRWPAASPVVTCRHPSSPVVTCRHPSSPVVTCRHPSSLVVPVIFALTLAACSPPAQESSAPQQAAQASGQPAAETKPDPATL